MTYLNASNDRFAVRSRITVVVIAVFVALCCARGDNILEVTETAETSDGINVMLNGAPLSGVLITGTSDNWLIQFPHSVSLDQSFAGMQAFVTEPENVQLGNLLTMIAPTVGGTPWMIVWQSDVDIGQLGMNPVTFPNAGTLLTDNGSLSFNLVLADVQAGGPRPGVPDGGATAMLLGGVLTGFVIIGRFARRR